MKKITIGEWIAQLEEEDGLSIEEFYGKLKSAQLAIEERLSTADADGVDLDMVDALEDDE